MAQNYSQIIEELGENRVKRDQLLAKYTTFKIGGPADLFYEAKSEKELIRVISLARKQKIPFFILGGGSNLLVSDQGVKGLVIKNDHSEFNINDSKIMASGGVKLTNLVKASLEAGLSGFEFAAGIPGSLGGAIVGNAGAWQESIGEKVIRVKVLDVDNQVKWLDQADCQFSYRQSCFKENKEIVLRAELQLEKGGRQKIKKKIDGNLVKRQDQAKEPSAGCVFINPKPGSAGKMIEACGLKGKRIGQAEISTKHANFIVNLGSAKASDVLALIELMKKKVKEKFKVDLETEIRLVGKHG